MAFKLRKVNHSPQWYYDHCWEEDGGSPAFRAMLRIDMAFIGADNDSHRTYQEKIGNYQEKWNVIFADWKSEDPNGVLLAEMEKAMWREDPPDPYEQFRCEPFSIIGDLMAEDGVDEKTLRDFLNCWAKGNLQAAERFKGNVYSETCRLITERILDEKALRKYLNWRRRRRGWEKRRQTTAEKSKVRMKLPRFFGYEGELELPVVEPEPPESP